MRKQKTLSIRWARQCFRQPPLLNLPPTIEIERPIHRNHYQTAHNRQKPASNRHPTAQDHAADAWDEDALDVATPELAVEPAPEALIEEAPPAANERQVLFSYQQPLIGSRVEGPRQIIVGREAHYQVTLVNSGQTAASDVLATIEIPAWADVADARASNGGVVESTDVKRPTLPPSTSRKRSPGGLTICRQETRRRWI